MMQKYQQGILPTRLYFAKPRGQNVEVPKRHIGQ